MQLASATSAPEHILQTLLLGTSSTSAHGGCWLLLSNNWIFFIGVCVLFNFLPILQPVILNLQDSSCRQGSLSSLLSALHSALIQPLALPCRTAVGNKTVYVPLLCPFAGQSVIALRTVNRIKLKQSSSLSHSLSLPPCYSNAICGIIMKKSQRKNWSEYRVQKYTVLCSRYNTTVGFSISKKRKRSFYSVNCNPLPFKTVLITSKSNERK